MIFTRQQLINAFTLDELRELRYELADVADEGFALSLILQVSSAIRYYNS